LNLLNSIRKEATQVEAVLRAICEVLPLHLARGCMCLINAFEASENQLERKPCVLAKIASVLHLLAH